MALELDAVGRAAAPYTARWDSTAALLYAVGVGAGRDELAFTTENSTGTRQLVLPTFAVAIGSGLARMPRFGEVDMAKLVHGEQRVTLERPIPVAGEVEITRRIVGIYDKGTAAVVASEATAIDSRDGALLYRTYSSSFIVGEGGWGGERGPTDRAPVAPPPDRPPDAEVTYETRPEQALIYRLSGDRNPLHSDPVFAARGGFDQPILHGLCTYGFAGRALLHELCASDPERFVHIEARFSATVIPGDTLTTRIWRTTQGRARFQTSRGDGTVVLDRGAFHFAVDGPAPPRPNTPTNDTTRGYRS